LKKLIGILLLLCLIVPVAGTFTWLHLHKKAVRKEVKKELIAGIDKNELVILTFTKNEADAELKWEHSKEFEYQDQMYDVIETKVTENSITYWCWWDHKETKLNKQLTSLLTQILGTDHQKKENQQKLLHFYQSLYLNKTYDWKSKNIATAISHDKSGSFKEITIPFSPITPPPKVS